MRPWPEQMKSVLRHLAAARYFLPEQLEFGDYPDSEAQLSQYLHHAEFELALDELEGLGSVNRGFAEEPLFWSELLLAARAMGLLEHAARYEAKLRESRRGSQEPNKTMEPTR